jgi:hypothetical protein
MAQFLVLDRLGDLLDGHLGGFGQHHLGLGVPPGGFSRPSASRMAALFSPSPG